ncbi:tol-pal system protein YbgF [Paraglaciecola agarilytica]|uniref:Cell division coordinator CpoB n=1 Tax=Paraglaciecola chathamensis TaxID=368405 RepID=A0ABS0WIU7_9ALTE|nr:MULTISPECIES: tol-pal system protein YbgF [Paraglaciecola]MBJ2138394.1 tol-pal system protein YbgF [Paraglaciecola chathamensis]MBU3017562.1 tol-pal system protein YbgF [Paraglaciecola agarilytica]MDO6841775.1 tol-pal system protein YbgF [Paraglaciecola chathamensis]
MNKRILALTLTAIFGAAVNAAPAPVADVSSGSTESRLATLERLFNTRTAQQHRVQEQLDLLQNEVNELRGSIEKHNYQLERILERQRELYLEIDKRIAAVMTPGGAQSAGELNQANQTNQGAATSLNEDQAYDKAVNLILKDKLYDDAIPEFQSFLQNYPNSSYASNAHYWLGQLLFNKQDWAAAANQFDTLITQFPDSSKRADAMLKLGICEQERSNIARAEQLWKKVVAEYPNSSARKLAEIKLNAVK